jgi:hypothetical protein
VFAFFSHPLIRAPLVFLGALYLYGMWTERRKKWRKGKSSSTPEENQPLGDGPRTDSDCEKGAVTAASKNENDVGYEVRPLASTGSCRISLTVCCTDSTIAAHRQVRWSIGVRDELNRVRSFDLRQTSRPHIQSRHLLKHQTLTAHL